MTPLNCTPETYLILLINVTPIISNNNNMRRRFRGTPEKTCGTISMRRICLG